MATNVSSNPTTPTTPATNPRGSAVSREISSEAIERDRQRQAAETKAYRDEIDRIDQGRPENTPGRGVGENVETRRDAERHGEDVEPGPTGSIGRDPNATATPVLNHGMPHASDDRDRSSPVLTDDKRTTNPDANPDPITGEPGSHPVGTGIGAASGTATGAAIGAVGGPVGAVIGAIAGGVTGGLIGHAIGEAHDPSEDAYWRDEYANRPYYNRDYTYADYEPAYRLGYNAADAGQGRMYDESLEAELAQHYDRRRGESRLSYDEARPAVRDAYERRRLSRTDGMESTGRMEDNTSVRGPHTTEHSDKPRM